MPLPRLGLSRLPICSASGWFAMTTASSRSAPSALILAARRATSVPRTSTNAPATARAIAASDLLRLWVVRYDDRFIAISAICTHLGCTPRYLGTEDKYKCPCHGSGYRGFRSAPPLGGSL